MCSFIKKTIFKMVPFLFVYCSFGQSIGDTIVVQAFDYAMTALGNSGNRDMIVSFPNDPNLTFEKIIMKYNMHCRNSAINTSGGNYVACGEWDYSCNTYVHDSTRIDSMEYKHPHYIIPGFSETQFDYSLNPTYDFYQYNLSNAVITNVIAENIGLIGSGASNISSVIPVQFESGRTQILVTASELLSAGIISGELTGLSLEILNGTSEVNLLKIRMKHTNNLELNTDTLENTNFTEVFFNNYNPILGDNVFQFSTPFIWNGVSNLILDLSFTNANGLPSQPMIDFAGEPILSNVAINNNLTDRYTSFSGEQQYISAPSGVYNFSNGMTYMGWIYYDDFSNWSRLMDFGNGPNADNIVLANPGLTNDLRLDIRIGTASTGFTVSNILTQGEWLHIAATVDNSGIGNLYLNGELIGSGAINLPASIYRANNYIGKSNWSSDAYFDGQMDDVSLWSIALSQSEIQNWMHKDIDATHPNFSSLLFSYNFNDNGNEATDISMNNLSGSFHNGVSNNLHKGKELFKNFEYALNRPNLSVIQGVYDQNIDSIIFIDSIQKSPHTIYEYAINSSAGFLVDDDILGIDTTYLYQVVPEILYDGETGDSIGAYSPNSIDGTLTMSDLTYFRRWPMKFEIMSFVTPYGLYLDLGPNGKTWNFDLTDFSPVFKGDMRLTMERGGQWNEDYDIQFLFIVGTPPSDVLENQQIWRNNYNGYSAIISDAVYEPRTITLLPQAEKFKIRSAITGHGQEGEFIPRTHQFNIDGGGDEFTWQVWKECADNPVYPQGGTWIYDRAGWCPGMPTDLKEMDITQYVNPGQSHLFDYDLASATGTSNYIVNHQLVQYGAPNFNLDGRIIDIMHPTNYVEYAKENPICANPSFRFQNSGSQTITEIEFNYWVNDASSAETYVWNGTLEFMEIIDIELPAPQSLWSSITQGGMNKFHVEISKVNGITDEYSWNNKYTSEFVIPDVLPRNFYVNFKTNNAALESSYQLINQYGDILFSRTGMTNGTIYRDTFDLTIGCYQLKINDTGDDGIDFWANSDGLGQLYLREVGGSTIKVFNGDFGGGLTYNFSIEYPLSYDELIKQNLFTVFPNPAQNHFWIEGADISNAEITIYDALGNKIHIESEKFGNRFKFESSILTKGVYSIQLSYQNKTQVEKIIIW